MCFIVKLIRPAVQCSSVTQLCPNLCNPMDCSMPGFPVHHQPPELAQTHVLLVGDVIQLSHPLLSPFPPAFNISQYQGLFQWVFVSGGPKYWSFSFSISPSNEYSGLKPDQNIHVLYSFPLNEMYIDQILIRKKVDWLYWIILLNHYKKSTEWFSGKNKSQM